MELPTYKSLEEKKKLFEYHETINSIKDINEKFFRGPSFNEFQKEPRGDSTFRAYRGNHEAKYMLYTSAQREWITNEWWLQGLTFETFIDRLLSNLREHDLLNRYIRFMGNIPNDLFRLALLQHYRSMSPLLDATIAKSTAYFFTLKDVTITARNENDIENYFSLYYIYASKDDIAPFHESFNVICDEQPKDTWNAKKKLDKLTQWKKDDRLWGKPIQYIAHPALFGKNVDTDDSKENMNSNKKDWLYWSNLNMVAQDGCFILNMNGNTPVEKMLHEAGCLSRTIMCYDIHKSLAGYIRAHLEHNKITDRKIFPSFEAITNEAYESFRRDPIESPPFSIGLY